MPLLNSPLSKLPSIHELIKHPQVQAVMDRINQTTLAGRAACYLEEMQSYLRQRTEQVPSIHQIAERFARHLLGNGNTGAPVINATGVVLGAELIVPPLAEVAIQEIVHLADEYHLAPASGQDSETQIAIGWTEQVEQVEQLLRESTGAESAWVASCTASAQWLIQQALGDKCDVQLAGPAGIVDPATFGLTSITPISDRLPREGQVVLFEGAGMMGGPVCGIVLGQRSLLDQLRHHAATPAMAANSLTLAALRATLNLYGGEQPPIHQIPVLQLLSAPLDNLRQRAERLAPLMQESNAIAEALPLLAESLWCQVDPAVGTSISDSKSAGVSPLTARVTSLTAPTWAISLRPVGDGLEASRQLLQRLRSGQRPVLARLSGDRVMLDMRSVFPRWDQALVAAIELDE
jgi:seryl-tRNA(Sec) selenium transferase